MPTPQFDIEREPPHECRFLVLCVPDYSRAQEVLSRMAGLPQAVGGTAAIDSSAGLSCAVGFGSAFWDVISPSRRPAALKPFMHLRADGREAPATGGDLMFHIMSGRADLSFILAFELVRMLGDAVRVSDDVRSLFYLDSRDMIGFIDGTENPQGVERTAAAIIGDEDPEFAGGTYLFSQRYVHNFDKWLKVPQTEQEKVIGRTKPDSIELSDEVKPPTAHIARVVIEEKDQELQIVRYSFPYGTVLEAGLMFLAYARDLATPHKMLSRMVGCTGDGLYDRLLEFTRPVSGANFFVPSRELLSELLKGGVKS
jgi:putative iron-dependent peroxidase